MPDMTDRRAQSNVDHDLLVTLHEQVRALREVDIPGLRDGFKKTLDDHEIRIRAIEYKQWLWTGAAGVIGALASLIVNRIFK